MLIQITFGMILGAVGILFYLATKGDEAGDEDIRQRHRGYKFYLNIIIQNKSQVIRKKASERVPFGVFGLGKTIVANVADAVVKDNDFAKKIGDSLKDQIPVKLKEKFGDGIKVSTDRVFVKDNLVVVSVQIAKANIVKLLGMQPDGGKRKSSTVQRIFDLLGKVSKKLESITESELNKKIADKIGAKLKMLLADEIKLKLRNESGVDVLIEAKHSSHQAEFFYSLMNKIELEKRDRFFRSS